MGGFNALMGLLGGGPGALAGPALAGGLRGGGDGAGQTDGQDEEVQRRIAAILAQRQQAMTGGAQPQGGQPSFGQPQAGLGGLAGPSMEMPIIGHPLDLVRSPQEQPIIGKPSDPVRPVPQEQPILGHPSDPVRNQPSNQPPNPYGMPKSPLGGQGGGWQDPYSRFRGGGARPSRSIV